MLSRLTGRRVFLSVRVRAVIGQVRLSLSRGSSCRAWWKALITPTERRPNICSRISSGRSRQDRALVVFLRTRPAPAAQPISSTARCSRSRKTRLRGGIPACQNVYPLEEKVPLRDVSPALSSTSSNYDTWIVRTPVTLDNETNVPLNRSLHAVTIQ